MSGFPEPTVGDGGGRGTGRALHPQTVRAARSTAGSARALDDGVCIGTANVALVVSSSAGIQFANPAFARLLKFEPDDFSPGIRFVSIVAELAASGGTAICSRKTRTGRFVSIARLAILDCNCRAGADAGCERGRRELVGRSLLELALDGPLLQKPLAVTRVERRAGPAELQLARVEAAVIDVSCMVMPVRSTSGVRSSRVRGPGHEITDTRSARRAAGRRADGGDRRGWPAVWRTISTTS